MEFLIDLTLARVIELKARCRSFRFHGYRPLLPTDNAPKDTIANADIP